MQSPLTSEELENLIKYMPSKLIEILGGKDKILALPQLSIDNSELGPLRDYIDFIKHDKVPNPIMIGVDKYRRTFIVFKFQFVLPTETKYITDVLFQRYTDETVWTSASNPPGIYSMLANGCRIDYERLQKVLTDGCVKDVHNYYHNVIVDYVLG